LLAQGSIKALLVTTVPLHCQHSAEKGQVLTYSNTFLDSGIITVWTIPYTKAAGFGYLRTFLYYFHQSKLDIAVFLYKIRYFT
jgi:hypothetical protein